MSTRTDFCGGFHVFKSPRFTASGVNCATFWDKCQMAQHNTRPFKERGHVFSVSPAPSRNLYPTANHGHKSFCLSRQRAGMWDVVDLFGDRSKLWTKKVIRVCASLGLCDWPPGVCSYPFFAKQPEPCKYGHSTEVLGTFPWLPITLGVDTKCRALALQDLVPVDISRLILQVRRARPLCAWELQPPWPHRVSDGLGPCRQTRSGSLAPGPAASDALGVGASTVSLNPPCRGF